MHPNTTTYEFNFRILLPPKDTDPATVTVWYREFEYHTGGRSVTEWATASLQELDIRDNVPNLEDSKCYEIVGTATIQGWYDSHTCEYDEELIITQSIHQEIDLGYAEEDDL